METIGRNGLKTLKLFQVSLYSVNFRIQSKFRKIRNRKNPNTDTFYAVNEISSSLNPSATGQVILCCRLKNWLVAKFGVLSGPRSPAWRINTQIYCIQCKYGKTLTKIWSLLTQWCALHKNTFQVFQIHLSKNSQTDGSIRRNGIFLMRGLCMIKLESFHHIPRRVLW